MRLVSLITTLPSRSDNRACRWSLLAVVFALTLPGGAADAASNQASVKSPAVSVWQARNRGVAISVDALNRRYTEFDSQGLTPDGILDTEQGELHGAAVRARWQGTLFGREQRPVQLQGEYRLHTGSTDYQGYMQSGTTLIPYSTTTQNEVNDFRLRVGVPFSRSVSVQWVPFMEYRYLNWMRSLSQYRETFQHHAGVAGLLVQWQPSRTWLLEADAAYGAMLDVQVDVPEFGFSGSLGKKPLWALGVSASYLLTNQWLAVIRIQEEKIRYAQSAASNGFVEPESITEQASVQLGIAYRY